MSNNRVWFGLLALAIITGAGFTLARVVRVRRDAAANQEKISGKDWCKIAHYLNGKLNAGADRERAMQ